MVDLPHPGGPFSTISCGTGSAYDRCGSLGPLHLSFETPVIGDPVVASGHDPQAVSGNPALCCAASRDYQTRPRFVFVRFERIMVGTSQLSVVAETAGPPGGWPVLLLHGFPYDPWSYAAVADGI